MGAAVQESAAAVLDFAVAQILRDDTALGARVRLPVRATGLRRADEYLEKPLRVDRLIATATALIARGRDGRK